MARYLVGLLLVVQLVWSWNSDTPPRMQIDLTENAASSLVQRFIGYPNRTDHFKVLHLEGEYMLVGGRNTMYNITLSDLKQKKNITWEATGCPTDGCQHYIRFAYKSSNGNLRICGTRAAPKKGPKCRTYELLRGGAYSQIGMEEDGIAFSPYDPNDNATAVYTSGHIFVATVADMNAMEPLIIRHWSNTMPLLRTVQSAEMLNQPDFVHSFEHGDHVYYLMRETALEVTEKAIYSRVARVCKNDRGANVLGLDSDKWTSFFKARLDCSEPGEFPFYFNEIQSVSMLNHDMIYAVFTTPRNAISASAVCAFNMSDIQRSFEGKFKAKESQDCGWQSIVSPVVPHPAARCVNNSQTLPGKNVNFIQKHSLMDTNVRPQGGKPLLIHREVGVQFTKIAIDWGVSGVEGTFNIMYIGTEDGRVLKAINQITIEEIRVFDERTPVLDLKLHKKGAKLVVVSKNEIKSIPLYRCNIRTTCKKCVALQDPYCSWKNGQCGHHVGGNDRLQNLVTGIHAQCPSDPTPPIVKSDSTTRASDRKTELPHNGHPSTKLTPSTKPTPASSKPSKTDTHAQQSNETIIDSLAFAASRSQENKFSSGTLALAVVLTLVLSLALGLGIGFLLSRHLMRKGNINENKFKEHRNGDTRKPSEQNRYDNEPIVTNHNESNSTYNSSKQSLQKQLNVVLNVKSKNTETKPIEYSTDTFQKPKKVYL